MGTWPAIAALAVVLASGVVSRSTALDRLLTGSEVDYVRAARRGILVNYLDQGTRPLREYLAAAGALASIADTEDGDADPDLWQSDIAAGDIAAYRHYHPPLFIYALTVTERLFGFSEVALRLVPLVLACATIVAVYLAGAWLAPWCSAQIGLVAAAILSALPLHVGTSTDIGWHVAYASVATVALLLMGLLLSRPSIRMLLATAAVMALAFATLEHAVFLIVTLVLLLLATDNPWLRLSRRGGTVHRGLCAAMIVFAVTFVAVWPASVVKLSVVKNLGVHAYYSRTLELSPRAYDVYLTLMTRYPVMCALAVFVAVVLALRRYQLPVGLLPFVVYPVCMGILQVGNVNLKPLYFVSMLPSLAILGAFCLVQVAGDLDRGRQRLVPLLMLVVTGGVVAAAVQALTRPSRTAPLTLFTRQLAASDDLVGARVLTWPPGNHLVQTLSFYLPDTRFHRAPDEPDEVRRFMAALQRGAFPFVIVERDSGTPVPGEALLWRAYAPFTELNAVEGFEVWRRRD